MVHDFECVRKIISNHIHTLLAVSLIIVPLLIARVIGCAIVGVSGVALFDSAVCTTYSLQLIHVVSTLRTIPSHARYFTHITCWYCMSATLYLATATYYQLPLTMPLGQLHILVWIHTTAIGALSWMLSRTHSSLTSTRTNAKSIPVFLYLLFLYTPWYDYLLYHQPIPCGAIACLLALRAIIPYYEHI
ncbi:MAG: hypothetical protein WCE21_02840 [Candidatus Babeliales bacterium]